MLTWLGVHTVQCAMYIVHTMHCAMSNASLRSALMPSEHLVELNMCCCDWPVQTYRGFSLAENNWSRRNLSRWLTCVLLCPTIPYCVLLHPIASSEIEEDKIWASVIDLCPSALLSYSPPAHSQLQRIPPFHLLILVKLFISHNNLKWLLSLQ